MSPKQPFSAPPPEPPLRLMQMQAKRIHELEAERDDYRCADLASREDVRRMRRECDDFRRQIAELRAPPEPPTRVDYGSTYDCEHGYFGGCPKCGFMGLTDPVPPPEPPTQDDWDALSAAIENAQTMKAEPPPGKYRDRLLLAAHQICEGGSDLDFLAEVDDIMAEIDDVAPPEPEPPQTDAYDHAMERAKALIAAVRADPPSVIRRETEDEDFSAGLIGQAIPDMVGTEPRPNFRICNMTADSITWARCVLPLGHDGSCDAALPSGRTLQTVSAPPPIDQDWQVSPVDGPDYDARQFTGGVESIERKGSLLVFTFRAGGQICVKHGVTYVSPERH